MCSELPQSNPLSGVSHQLVMNSTSKVLFGLLLGLLLSPQATGQSGRIEIDISEEKSGDPLVCRIEILNPFGKSMRARGATFLGGWNLVDGTLAFVGKPGEYRYEIQHGPQFSKAHGGFTLDKNASAIDVVSIPRHANLTEEGWYGGDLYTSGDPAKVLPWLAADDLRMAVSVKGRGDDSDISDTLPGAWVETQSYADNRPGSGLLIHHWLPPAEVPSELPSAQLLVLAKKSAVAEDSLPVHTEIRRIGARDVPIWLASGLVDSIQLLGDQIGPDVRADKPFYDPDPGRFEGARGPGRAAEHLYWQVLEAGFRIPPSAGSGFLASKNWLGSNRVYVNLGSPTRSGWWTALKEGRSFVTSGPLLRATINGRLPGDVIHVDAGKKLTLEVAATLTVSDAVDYLDVIFNGRSLYEARLDEHARRGGKIPGLVVEESGWAVIRVITSEGGFYKIATTAPFYVEVGGKPRISRKAVQLFRDWLSKAEEDVAKDAKAAALANPYFAAANRAWAQRAEQATCE